MFCPNCGTGDQSPNAYCKHCGQWLLDQKSVRSHTATPEKRLHAMIVFNALSAVFGLASTIILYATLGKPGAKVAMLVAAAFCTVIAVHQTISFFFALELRQRLKRGRADTRQLRGPDTGRSVASLGGGETAEFINARSVTENTTELLESVPRVRKPGDSS